MKKLEKMLSTIFSWGVLLSLFAGAVAGVGFVLALFVGGENATKLCMFIHKEYFPIVIQVCTIATGCGLISIYLQKAMMWRRTHESIK